MSKHEIDIIKIGGNIIDDEKSLQNFVAQLALRKTPFVLIHGGGKVATTLSKTLGIETKMIEGRRITDAETLNVVVMVYAGLINKKIVALLQAENKNAIGLCGADANIIQSEKRVAEIDYGFVGNVQHISVDALRLFIDNNFIPVLSAITHDRNGQLLNTNADTIASEIAVTLSNAYDVSLYYCFEKNGVLENADDDNSVIEKLNANFYGQLKSEKKIHSGMIPKLDNAFAALNNNVKQVFILHANKINEANAGTELVK